MKIMTKRSVYPAAIGVVLLGLTVWFLSQFQISIQYEGVPSPVDPPPVQDEPSPPVAVSPTPATSPPTAAPTTTPIAAPATPTAPQRAIAQTGALRVSNQTDHPVRVALLSRHTKTRNADGSERYGEPIHWDFAPQEGSTKGLLLALPEGEADLQVQTGDVLTAFAQDGSRRYWGPYVVGETAAPVWNATSQEWDLVLSK